MRILVNLSASSGVNLRTIESFDTFSSPELMFTPLEIMSHCSKAGLTLGVIPAGTNAPRELLTGFTEGILLRRLIRSLEDRHSMVTGCLIQLGLQALFKKEESLVFVFIHQNSC
jgi:hypothetical protein